MAKILGLKSALRDANQRYQQMYKRLLQEEAKVGGRIFGPVGKSGRRDFFCLNERTWIWYEEWVDSNGKRQSITTRYDVRPDGIVKAQDGQPYKKLEGQEATNFLNAVNKYVDEIVNGIYSK